MQQKTKAIRQELLEKILLFEDCAGIVFPISEVQELDPYFTISIDIMYKKQIPSLMERQSLSPHAELMEMHREKDRFLFENLPVHIYYKPIKRYESLLKHDWSGFFEDSFALRRLVRSDIAHDPKEILDKACDMALKPPLEFWQNLVKFSFYNLEHCIEDIQSGIARNDLLYVSISNAHAIDALVKLVFALNKAFLPSVRFYGDFMSEFVHQFEGFMKDFNQILTEISIEKKSELIILMSKTFLKYIATIPEYKDLI